MKSWQLLIGSFVLAIFCAEMNADAATLTVRIDGQSRNVPLRLEYDAERPNGYFDVGAVDGEGFEWEVNQGKIEIEGELDPDPALIFGGTVTDFGTPTTFGFTFILPLAPVFPNPSVVFDSFSGSVTNGTSAGGVTVTAVAPPAFIPVDGDGITEIQVYTLSDDGGLTWKNVGLDQGPTTTISPLASFAAGLYGAYNAGPIATIPGGPWTHMRADINFSLSGGGDNFNFNGAKTLIPEPSAAVLVIMSLVAGLGACRRVVR